MSSKDKEPAYSNIKNIKDSQNKDTSSLSTEKSETQMELVNLKPERIKGEKQNLLKDSSGDFDLEIVPDSPIVQSSEDTKPNLKGNMYLFWYDKNGNPRIAIGPNWPFFVCLTSFISIICSLYFYGLWNLLNVYIRNAGLLIVFTQLTSYTFLFLINPGIPDKSLWLENYKGEDLADFRICNICKIVMRPEDNTEHCEDCDICIVGLDHHCPWTSKCVGKNNLILFYIFVSSTFILMFYLIFALFSLAATAS